MRKFSFFLFLTSYFFLEPRLVSAQVIISEVYPAPPTGESEWVELFNSSSEAISLTGWKLRDQLATPSDIYSFTDESIAPLSFLVAQLPTAKLNNTSDGVTLYSQFGEVINTMSYANTQAATSWQLILASTGYILSTPSKGGDSLEYPLITNVSPTPSPFSTPFPSPSASADTNLPLATPTPIVTPEPIPTSTPQTLDTAPTPTPQPTLLATPTALPSPSPAPNTPLITLTPTPTPVSTSISPQLSEFMACPDSGSEWLELYNPSETDIEITNWKITDTTGNYRTFSGVISKKSFGVFSWSSGLLNNSGDGFSLASSTGQVTAQLEYEDCHTGMSFVYTLQNNTGNWILTVPTPSMENVIVPTSLSSVATPSASLSPKITVSSLSPALSNVETATSISSLWEGSSPQILGAQFSQITSSFFKLPELKTVQIATTSALPTRYLSQDHTPNKGLSIGAILSGTLAFCSSCVLLYGKKIVTTLTTLG